MAILRTSEIEVSAKTLGAELTSIKGKDGTEYLWQADPKFWPRQSPLLFPIVGALPGGSYTHAGVTYKMGNHGFARDWEFAFVGEERNLLRYQLRADSRTLALYPFRFTLGVTYRASGRTLAVEWRVRNDDRTRMIFSIGAHPAFRAPIVPGEKREDFDLIFQKKETVRRHLVNADNLRSGESEPFLSGQDRVAVSPALFERGAIVLLDHVSREVTMRSRSSGRFVTVRFPGFPYLGIWSPKGDVPFVCIEPWHGVAPRAGSSPELAVKEGCLALEPDREFRTVYEIEVG